MRAEIHASTPDLLALLSAQLYRSPEVFVRELVCNGYDAILRREVQGSKAARKVVVRGSGAGVVSVEDDGIGMTEGDLHDLLSCIGRSGTREATALGSRRIGRFGLGFLSALAVARRIEVDSLAAPGGRDRAVRWIWSGGVAYEVERGSRSEPGTVVTVHLKPELTGYAAPGALASIVQKHLPFLDVTIEVPPLGDPRSADVPWRRGRTGAAVSRERLDPQRFPRAPIHAFAATLRAGGVMLVFPTSAVAGDRRLQVCHRGVLIGDDVRDVIPAGWEWVSGIVDVLSGNPTLDRERLLPDGQLGELREELRELLEDELAYLARHVPPVFAKLIGHHRPALVDLLHTDSGLRARMSPHYRWTTTLGDKTFPEALGLADVTGGRRSLVYLRSSPSADARWSAARAAGRLVIWCRDTAEESLLLDMVRAASDVELGLLTWGEKPTAGQETPPIPEDVRQWMGRLRAELAPHRVLVEPASFGAAGLVSVVELPDDVDDARDAVVEGVEGTLRRFFQSLSVDPTAHETHGRLLVNTGNETVRAIASAPEQGWPVEVCAALLFAGGAARSGLPLPPAWQPVLDRLMQSGTAALVRRDGAPRTASHVVCFFAHEFAKHKEILRALRAALEHFPFFWEVRSPEELTQAPRLFDNVCEQIAESHVVFGEISTRNPNVVLELGIAFGLGGRHVALLADRQAPWPFCDIGGHIVFLYDGAMLQRGAASFVEAIRRWVPEVAALQSCRLASPFLGYRLLVEQSMVTPQQCQILSTKYEDVAAFLAEPPHLVGRHLGLDPASARRAQDYFHQRIAQHRGLIEQDPRRVEQAGWPR